MKSKSIRKVKKDTWVVFSRYIRFRDCLATTGSLEYGECFTCSNQFEFRELQAGHFVPKHAGNYFSERGVHAQCRSCNLYGRNGQAAGMPLEYRRQIVEMYGEEVALELEAEPNLEKKFTIEVLEELNEMYLNKIEELKGEQ